MTPATDHPPAPESALRPLARAALCLPALLAASTFARLQIIPLCIAFFYSRVGLGQLGTLLVILACLCGADSFCLRRLLGWVRGGLPLLAGVVILTGILRGTGFYLVITQIWSGYLSSVRSVFTSFFVPEILLWIALGCREAWVLTRKAGVLPPLLPGPRVFRLIAAIGLAGILLQLTQYLCGGKSLFVLFQPHLFVIVVLAGWRRLYRASFERLFFSTRVMGTLRLAVAIWAAAMLSLLLHEGFCALFGLKYFYLFGLFGADVLLLGGMAGCAALWRLTRQGEHAVTCRGGAGARMGVLLAASSLSRLLILAGGLQLCWEAWGLNMNSLLSNLFAGLPRAFAEGGLSGLVAAADFSLSFALVSVPTALYALLGLLACQYVFDGLCLRLIPGRGRFGPLFSQAVLTGIIRCAAICACTPSVEVVGLCLLDMAAWTLLGALAAWRLSRRNGQRAEIS